MINTVVLVGRLTAAPELKTTTTGVSTTSFCIAVERPHKKDAEKQTDFINIVAFRGTAEFIEKHFNKGDMIGIEGRIQTRKYQDKDGNNRTAFEVVVNNVHFVGAKNKNFRETDNNTLPENFSEIANNEPLPF